MIFQQFTTIVINMMKLSCQNDLFEFPKIEDVILQEKYVSKHISTTCSYIVCMLHHMQFLAYLYFGDATKVICEWGIVKTYYAFFENGDGGMQTLIIWYKISP